MGDEPFAGGTASQRIGWVEEPTEGTVPAEPSWNLFSDNITSWRGGDEEGA